MLTPFHVPMAPAGAQEYETMGLLISLISLAGLFGAFLTVQRLHVRLPAAHLSDETQDTLRLGVGVIATLSGLVLGLVLSSMKSDFDTVQRDVRRFGTQLVSLDTSLRAFGPSATASRESLLNYSRAALRGTWPEQSQAPIVDDDEAAATLQRLERSVIELPALDRAQIYYGARARTMMGDIVRMRATLIGENDSYLQPVFLVFFLSWLGVLFASFGFRAPNNATVTVGAFCAALVVSSAVFLMIELDGPFTGFIAVSGDPLRQAIVQLQKP